MSRQFVPEFLRKLLRSDSKQSVSETTRETSFKFSVFHDYYNTLFKNKSHLSDEWLTWFIGFAEGDGAIQTYDEGKRVRFVLTQKESDILYKIQFKFNIGVVKHFPQGKSGKNNDFYRWIVDNPSHILLLAYLFNGNLA
uniref:orf138 n=1 Tax=Podospora anserina TaxID=2587412 RepID=UPI0000166154|nr:orf138 [Podospora anserina]